VVAVVAVAVAKPVALSQVVLVVTEMETEPTEPTHQMVVADLEPSEQYQALPALAVQDS
jgi:hypothetical protein